MPEAYPLWPAIGRMTPSTAAAASRLDSEMQWMNRCFARVTHGCLPSQSRAPQTYLFLRKDPPAQLQSVDQRYAELGDNGPQFLEVALRLIGERNRCVADPADLDAFVNVQRDGDDLRVELPADDAR